MKDIENLEGKVGEKKQRSQSGQKIAMLAEKLRGMQKQIANARWGAIGGGRDRGMELEGKVYEGAKMAKKEKEWWADSKASFLLAEIPIMTIASRRVVVTLSPPFLAFVRP